MRFAAPAHAGSMSLDRWPLSTTSSTTAPAPRTRASLGCAARASTISKTSISSSRATGLWCSRGCRARANRRLPSTPSMPRASGAMWKSLSSYARQFLEMMQKPDVDQIDGLSPAISIEQKTTSQKPALDGRHRHRDLRLHASALGAGRHPLLARDRAADREPDGQPDGRPGAGAAGKNAAVPARARGARPQGRVPQGDRRVSEKGLSAPQDRRRILRHRRDPDARQEAQARHRRGGGPHRGARPTSARGWRNRSRPRWSWRTALR